MPAAREALDLGDHDPAPSPGGACAIESMSPKTASLLHREVAVLVRGGGPDEGDVDRERVVEQATRAAEVHDLDEVLGGCGVLPAAALARVDEGAQADVGDQAGPPAGDLAHSCESTPCGNE